MGARDQAAAPLLTGVIEQRPIRPQNEIEMLDVGFGERFRIRPHTSLLSAWKAASVTARSCRASASRTNLDSEPVYLKALAGIGDSSGRPINRSDREPGLQCRLDRQRRTGRRVGPPARTPARNGVRVNGWPQSSWDETETLDCAIDAAKVRGTGLRGPRQRADDSELGAPRECATGSPVPGKVALPKVADPDYATGAQMTAASRGIARCPGGPWGQD